MVVWLWWQHKGRKAAAVAGGSLLLLLPVAVARLAAGVPLAGARYSQELGAYYSNTLFDRLGHVAHGFGLVLLHRASRHARPDGAARFPDPGAWRSC